MNVYGALVEWYCLDKTAALRQTCLSDIFSTTYSTWSGLGLTSGLCDKEASDWPPGALFEGSYSKYKAYVNFYSLQSGLDVVWFLMRKEV